MVRSCREHLLKYWIRWSWSNHGVEAGKTPLELSASLYNGSRSWLWKIIFKTKFVIMDILINCCRIKLQCLLTFCLEENWNYMVFCSWLKHQRWSVAAGVLIAAVWQESQFGSDTNVGCLHKVGQLQWDSDTSQCQESRRQGVRSWDRWLHNIVHWSTQLTTKVHSRFWDSVTLVIIPRLQTWAQSPTWGYNWYFGWDI